MYFFNIPDNICLTLSDAISRGDQQFASNLAQQLAAQKASVKIGIVDPEQDKLTAGIKDNKIKFVHSLFAPKYNKGWIGGGGRGGAHLPWDLFTYTSPEIFNTFYFLRDLRSHFYIQLIYILELKDRCFPFISMSKFLNAHRALHRIKFPLYLPGWD